MSVIGFDAISSIFDLGKTAIEKIWPDPIKRAEEMRKLEELRQNGDLAKLDSHVKIMLAQLEVNKEEAKSSNVFVAGWRPFVGWVGGFSLAYSAILHPILVWVFTLLKALGYIPDGVDAPPFIESGILGTVVTGMLGIGTMRSYDKTKGNAK